MSQSKFSFDVSRTQKEITKKITRSLGCRYCTRLDLAHPVNYTIGLEWGIVWGLDSGLALHHYYRPAGSTRALFFLLPLSRPLSRPLFVRESQLWSTDTYTSFSFLGFNSILIHRHGQSDDKFVNSLDSLLLALSFELEKAFAGLGLPRPRPACQSHGIFCVSADSSTSSARSMGSPSIS
jgi:hypothetical protein